MELSNSLKDPDVTEFRDNEDVIIYLKLQVWETY